MEEKHQFNKGYLKCSPKAGTSCSRVQPAVRKRVCRSPALRASERYGSEVLVQDSKTWSLAQLSGIF